MSRPRRVGAVVRHGRDAAGLDASAHRRCDLGQSHDFHYLWLRDNCRCPECRDPDAWERLFDTVAMPQDLTPRRIDGAISDSPTTSTTCGCGTTADALNVATPTRGSGCSTRSRCRRT